MSSRASAPRVLTVDTPVGEARAHVHPSARRGTRSTVVLGHGAGGGVEARDLAALADELPRHGHRVVLVEQPWRVSGRKVAPAPASLDRAWCAVLDALRARGELRGVVVTGGRSAGARSACRTASAVGADALVLLAFPLHPPGRPERSRADELAAAGAPARVLQGGRDSFGTAGELRATLAGAPRTAEVAVTEVPWADHGLAVPARAPLTQAEALEVVTGAALAALAEWCPGCPR